MADEVLLEPLLDVPFDEALLKELAALDAAEAQDVQQQAEQYVDDADVYKMKELIRWVAGQVASVLTR